jgi:hypothetical protein
VLKLGLPDWVRRRGGRPLPAAGNPNLNLKKRPEVNSRDQIIQVKNLKKKIGRYIIHARQMFFKVWPGDIRKTIGSVGLVGKLSVKALP